MVCDALLQGVLQQLLDMGVVSTLTEDLQWNIRMLLPRQVCAWSPPLPCQASGMTCALHASPICSRMLEAATLRMPNRASGLKASSLRLPGTGRAADRHAPRWAAAVLHLWAAHVQHRRARQRHERRPPSVTASGMLRPCQLFISPNPGCTSYCISFALHASRWIDHINDMLLAHSAEPALMHRDCWCSKRSRISRRRRRSRRHRSSRSRTRRRWGTCSR